MGAGPGLLMGAMYPVAAHRITSCTTRPSRRRIPPLMSVSVRFVADHAADRTQSGIARRSRGYRSRVPLWFPELRLILTAAPGTGSTALTETALAGGGCVDVMEVLGARRAGELDPKHATLTECRAAGLDVAVERVVTGTRDPFDFYVAEWYRTRTRWAADAADPTSWVHRVDGMAERIRLAVDHDFPGWMRHVFTDTGDSETGDVDRDGRRRLNPGHVEEATAIIRMEHMDDDLRRLVPDLADLLGAIPMVNRTDRDRDHRRRYDAWSRRAVESAHRRDCRRFGYSFDGSARTGVVDPAVASGSGTFSRPSSS